MERVRILLRTRHDDYPAPRSLSIPSTPSGPAPGRRVRCPVCQGRKRKKLCERCEGRGGFEIDSYTGVVAGTTTPRPEPMSSSRRETELQRLETALKLSAGEVDPNESYGWERAMQRRDRSGSYRELERCLEHLRSTDHLAWEYVTWVYNGAVEFQPSKTEDQIVALLASWMPAKIKLPRHLARDLAVRREELVRSLAKQHVDLESIAEQALCSVATVKKILGRPRLANNPKVCATLTVAPPAGAA